ncbi:hypothetical protein EJB05_36102, partial [Eragrostis curvula]
LLSGRKSPVPSQAQVRRSSNPRAHHNCNSILVHGGAGGGRGGGIVPARAIEVASSAPGGKRRGLPCDAEPSSSSAMAAQVAADPTSGSGSGGKRCRPDHDAEPSSSFSAASKRRHRLSVPQFHVAPARVSDERDDREDLESEEDLDYDYIPTYIEVIFWWCGHLRNPGVCGCKMCYYLSGFQSRVCYFWLFEIKLYEFSFVDVSMPTIQLWFILGRARTREGAAGAGAVGPHEQQLQSKILLSEIMKLKKNDELLIPFADFLRLVKEITGRHSRGVSRWTPKALLSLHEAAEDYLLEVFKVNQLAADDTVQPNLCYGDNTKLTPEQEAAARGFSRACTSGIPMYICTMKTSNVMKRQLAFSRDFSKCYILPRLGYDCCETKVFAGCNRFGSKLNLSMVHGELRLLGGWPLFVKDNRIEAGHICAFIFEEEKEEEEDDGALLSLRVHVLGAGTNTNSLIRACACFLDDAIAMNHGQAQEHISYRKSMPDMCLVLVCFKLKLWSASTLSSTPATPAGDGPHEESVCGEDAIAARWRIEHLENPEEVCTDQESINGYRWGSPWAWGLQQQQQKKMKKQHRRPLLLRIGAGNRMVILFGPFARLVREITEFHSRKVTRWTPEAILLLQDVSEFYLEVMLENRLTFTTQVDLELTIITVVLEELEGSEYMGEHIVTEPAATATTRQQRKQEEPSRRVSTPSKRARRRNVEAPAEGAGIRELWAKRARWPSSRYPASDWVVRGSS